VDVNIGSGNVDLLPAKGQAGPHLTWDVRSAAARGAAGPDTLHLYYGLDGSGKLTVHDFYDGPAGAPRPELRLTLTVPDAAQLSVDVGAGVLNLNANASVTAKLGQGDILLNGKVPDSSVSLGDGDLQASLELTTGEHALSVASGKLEVSLLPGSSCGYEAATAKGKITLAGVPGSVEPNGVGHSAEGQTGFGGAHLTLHMGRGSINLSGASKDQPTVGDSF
jgi:hypothetical protein